MIEMDGNNHGPHLERRNWAFADLMDPDGTFNFDAKVNYF